MPTQFEKLSLDNINNGAVPELFAEAWADLMKDVADIQKPADAARAVTIEIKVKPNKERGIGAVEITVKTKLPAGDPSVGYVHFAMEGEHVAAYVNNP